MWVILWVRIFVQTVHGICVQIKANSITHFDWMNKAANNSHQTITNQNNWPYPITSHSIIVRHSTTVSFPCPIFYSFLTKNTKLADLMSQTQHCMMFHVVESFCTKFETGLTFSYSMCKQTQQMLGVVGQQCCIHLHRTLQLYF